MRRLILTFRWARATRLAASAVSLLLVIALGTAAILTTSSASREASAIHASDRSKAQQVLAGLTAQYLKFMALELSQLGDAGHWSLQAGNGVDTRRLRDFIASSTLFDYGAAVVDLAGRPLAIAAQRPGLPKPTDPGYAPLFAGLRARTFGVSDVMRVGQTPLVAIAVPILVSGLPRALLIGYTDARHWPLGVYTAHQVRFDPTATSYIVDANGRVAAAGLVSAVGRRIAAPLANVGESGSGLTTYSDHGQTYVAVYSPTGIAGWRTMTVEPAAAFSGSLDRHASAVGVTLIALLAAAIGALVLLTLKRNQALRRLADEALCDQLTGLQSRRVLEMRLDAALTKQQRTQASLGVLFSDLDGFKAINDRFGHAAGDAALVEVARRLRSAVRAGDSVARLSGDEFVVLLEDIDIEGLSRVAASLRAAVTGPVLVRGSVIDLCASLGCVLVRPEPTSSAAVLHAADLAMYRSKKTGRIEISDFQEVDQAAEHEGELSASSAARGAAA